MISQLLLPGFKPYNKQEIESLDWDRLWLAVQVTPGEAIERILVKESHFYAIDTYIDVFWGSYRFPRGTLQDPIGMCILPSADSFNTVYDPEHPYSRYVLKRLKVVRRLLGGKIPDSDALDLASEILF
jgi:hypothetical protein